MEDAKLVACEAAKLVRRHGHQAPAFLHEAAERSADSGDLLSAQAWGDLARAAEALLASRRR
jgi:hypothetical protein